MKQGLLSLRPGITTFKVKTADPQILTEELAYDADALLGYTGMRKSLGIAGPLGRALTELGINPYKPEEVDAYKERLRAVRIDELQAQDRSSFPSNYWSRVKWEEFPLTGYQNYVEPFALDIARSIKLKLPDVQFFVDVLIESSYGPPGDPFLIARRGEESFFVAVWDEPEFEAKQKETE